MKLALVGQDFTSRSLAVSAQTCVNLFPALLKDPNDRAKNIAVLYGTPGKHLAVVPGGTLRSLWSGGGRLFVVNGTTLKEFNAAYGLVSSHALPGAADDGLPAQIFSNGNQLLIVAGGKAYCDNGAGPVACTTDDYAGVVNVFGTGVGWISGDKFLDDGTWVGRAITINGVGYTVGSTPAPPTKTQLYLTAAAGIQPGVLYSALGEALTAVTGGYLDGTFFVQRPRTPGAVPDLGRQVNFSAVLNGLSWSGLDFFSKEGYPDYIRGLHVDPPHIYLFGDETFEVWQSDASARAGSNPFVRIDGAGGRFGSRSAWGQRSLAGTVFFLGGDDRGEVSAYMLDGFTPRRISTHAAEAAWKAGGLGSNAVTYEYTEEGHSFWVINFGTQTWAYETETGAWHQRYHWDGAAFTPYKTNLHTFIPEWGAGGRHITALASGSSEALYESSASFYDDAGGDIKWQRALPYIYNEGKWQFFGRFDLEMETGSVASGAEPVVTLDYSDDRGKTFVNPRTMGIGAHDETARRVFCLRGGKSRGRVPRISGVGQSRVALVDATWDVTVGTV